MRAMPLTEHAGDDMTFEPRDAAGANRPERQIHLESSVGLDSGYVGYLVREANSESVW